MACFPFQTRGENWPLCIDSANAEVTLSMHWGSEVAEASPSATDWMFASGLPRPDQPRRAVPVALCQSRCVNRAVSAAARAAGGPAAAAAPGDGGAAGGGAAAGGDAAGGPGAEGVLGHVRVRGRPQGPGGGARAPERSPAGLQRSVCLSRSLCLSAKGPTWQISHSLPRNFPHWEIPPSDLYPK